MGKSLDRGSTLIVAEGCAAFVGGIVDTESHSHHAMQISIALDRDFRVELGGKVLQAASILIDSDFPHRVSGEGARQMLVLIEPESPRGAALKSRLGGEGYAPIGLTIEDIESIRGIAEEDSSGIREIVGPLLSALGAEGEVSNPPDPRLGRIFEILSGAEGRAIGVEELARRVALSESRLQHLFKAETGISIKKYLLWKKMIDGIFALLDRGDITWAAQEAGFFDSAHLSRTFKRMFGLKPFEVFKDSRSVQARRG
jgi:AraC-like DNA-binding protein